MSDNDSEPGEEGERLPLVMVSEIRDIQMVSVEAHAPEERYDELQVQLQMGKSEFRASKGELFIRITARIEYFDVGATESDRQSESLSLDTAEKDPVAFIEATYLIQLDLESHVDPNLVSPGKVNELVEANIIFMLYPYVRSTVHRLAGEMPFPPTVLPYLRR